MPDVSEARLVDASAAQQRIAALRDQNASYAWISARTGVTSRTLWDIASGRSTSVMPDTHNRVLIGPHVYDGPLRTPGQAVPGEERGVPTGPVRAHIEFLHASKMTDAQIAAASGVSARTIRAIRSGTQPSVYGRTAAALMKVQPQGTIRSTPASRVLAMLDDMRARGWSTSHIARAGGVAPSTIAPSRLSRRRVTPAARDAICRAYTTLGRACGPGTRPRPDLVRALDVAVPASRIAAEAGVSDQTVSRARRGRPVGQDVAARLLAWSQTRSDMGLAA